MAPTSNVRTPPTPQGRASNPVDARTGAAAAVFVMAVAVVTMVEVWESVPALFVAVSVNVTEPAEVGVPDTTPVDESNTSPLGRAPDDTVNVTGPVPVAVTVAEYGVPTVAAGSEPVVIDGATTAAATATV